MEYEFGCTLHTTVKVRADTKEAARAAASRLVNGIGIEGDYIHYLNDEIADAEIIETDVSADESGVYFTGSAT